VNERTNETRWPIDRGVMRLKRLVRWRVFEKAMNGRGNDLKNMAWSRYKSKHRKRPNKCNTRDPI
jgi:hypothetical protein